MQTFGTVVAFAHDTCPEQEFEAVVDAIHRDIRTDTLAGEAPTWDCDDIALIDLDGHVLALGWLPPDHDDDPWYLVASIGRPQSGPPPAAQLIDDLVARLKVRMGADPAMTAQAHQPVTAAFIDLLFDMLRSGETNSDIACLDVPALPAPAPAAAPVKGADRFEPIETMHWDFSFAESDIGTIQQDDVDMSDYQAAEWLAERAKPTHTLRLTVHTLALSLMLYAPPLGVFLFVYALLRDVMPMTA